MCMCGSNNLTNTKKEILLQCLWEDARTPLFSIFERTAGMREKQWPVK